MERMDEESLAQFLRAAFEVDEALARLPADRVEERRYRDADPVEGPADANPDHRTLAGDLAVWDLPDAPEGYLAPTEPRWVQIYEEHLARINGPHPADAHTVLTLAGDIIVSAAPRIPTEANVQQYHAELFSQMPQPSTRDQLIRTNRVRAQQLRYKVADRRARALLLEHLTEEQTKTWDSHGYFNVVVPVRVTRRARLHRRRKRILGPIRSVTTASERVYRIQRARSSFNVTLIGGPSAIGQGGRSVRIGDALCCTVWNYVPCDDIVLAQKLMLEYDEATFLRLANIGRRAWRD